jgi:hypothetical protein
MVHAALYPVPPARLFLNIDGKQKKAYPKKDFQGWVKFPAGGIARDFTLPSD